MLETSLSLLRHCSQTGWRIKLYAIHTYEGRPAYKGLRLLVNAQVFLSVEVDSVYGRWMSK